MNPFQELNLPATDDDSAIRQAYLEAVKRNPPERNPEKFRRINAAYESIKDQKKRALFELFDKEPGITSPFEALIESLEPAANRKPPTLSSLKEYLQQCLTPRK